MKVDCSLSRPAAIIALYIGIYISLLMLGLIDRSIDTAATEYLASGKPIAVTSISEMRR